MTLPPSYRSFSSTKKDALLATLLARLAALEAEMVALRAENAALQAENAALREQLRAAAEDARQFQHTARAGAQEQWRRQAPTHGQGACRGAPSAAPEPDPETGRSGRAVPALPGRCIAGRAGRGAHL
jgi:hypothetical protein